jgi:hypothetical protein
MRALLPLAIVVATLSSCIVASCESLADPLDDEVPTDGDSSCEKADDVPPEVEAIFTQDTFSEPEQLSEEKSVLENVVLYLRSNPFLAAALAFSLLRCALPRLARPLFRLLSTHVSGDVVGSVVTMRHPLELTECLRESAHQCRLLAIDASTAVQTSRTASYAQLSEELTECNFTRFDVGSAAGVARQLGVCSAPCFVIFRDGAEVQRVDGCLEKEEMRALLLSHGASEVQQVALPPSWDKPDGEKSVADIQREFEAITEALKRTGMYDVEDEKTRQRREAEDEGESRFEDVTDEVRVQ